MKSLSPLRYPGGKTKLFPYMNKIIEYNHLNNATYVEPFAGGSGLALALLEQNIVSNIIINDYDYAIYAFWHSILNDKDEFCDRIREIDITVNQWDVQKGIYLNQDNNSLMDIAIATFFLNRTNRSGIINGGMIGGREQKGQYTIDCRFNKENLIKKIEKIYALSDRIQIYNLDVFELINNIIVRMPMNKTFIYFDPPYVNKGHQLYKNFFKFDDHVNLKEHIAQLHHKWLITYDYVDEIATLYKDYSQDIININYSAGTKKIGKELAIFSDNLLLPPSDSDK